MMKCLYIILCRIAKHKIGLLYPQIITWESTTRPKGLVKGGGVAYLEVLKPRFKHQRGVTL